MISRWAISISLSCIISAVIGLGWGLATYDDIHRDKEIYKYIVESESSYFTNMPNSRGYKEIISEKNISKYKGDKHHKPIPASYNQIISNKAKKYNIEPSLVKAVIKAESNWDSDEHKKSL